HAGTRPVSSTVDALPSDRGRRCPTDPAHLRGRSVSVTHGDVGAFGRNADELPLRKEECGELPPIGATGVQAGGEGAPLQAADGVVSEDHVFGALPPLGPGLSLVHPLAGGPIAAEAAHGEDVLARLRLERDAGDET